MVLSQTLSHVLYENKNTLLSPYMKEEVFVTQFSTTVHFMYFELNEIVITKHNENLSKYHQTYWKSMDNQAHGITLTKQVKLREHGVCVETCAFCSEADYEQDFMLSPIWSFLEHKVHLGCQYNKYSFNLKSTFVNA